MLLMFGKASVDTKGLPRVSVINSHGRRDGTVYIVAKLESATRAAVEKWAKRLGVEVTEGAGYSADERQVRAEAESDGCQLHVYTYVPAAPADSDPAEFPWRVYAQPEGGARWLVNAFATRERAERFAERHPDQYGPLTIEPADAPAGDGEPVHWAIEGGPACRTRRFFEQMTRTASDVTCDACRALIPNGGAS